MTTRPACAARRIGAVARDLLRGEQDAAVMGRTSRGVFLRLDRGWVIFLSAETFPGPLTLNVSCSPGQLEAIEAGPARITQEGLFFPHTDLAIQTGQTQVWAPPLRPLPILTRERRSAMLEAVIRLAAAKKGAGGFSALLPVLWGDRAGPGGGEGAAPLYLENLKRSLAGCQSNLIARAMEPFLGLGTGLTPSGDDLVLGLLLALNRWGELLAPHLDVTHLNQVIRQAAYRKTTTLSANLIECAAQGQADERLVMALDSMMTGLPEAAVAVETLSGWGNSSGFDALIGMTLGIRTFP